MQAQLPESLEQLGLKDLVNGDVVYTVPWAMFADKKGLLWLNGEYSFDFETGGTVQMKVSKVNGKYICDVSKCRNHGWSKSESTYFGEFEPLPVSELLGM